MLKRENVALMSLTPSLIALFKIAFTYLIFQTDWSVTQGNDKI